MIRVLTSLCSEKTGQDVGYRIICLQKFVPRAESMTYRSEVAEIVLHFLKIRLPDLIGVDPESVSSFEVFELHSSLKGRLKLFRIQNVNHSDIEMHALSETLQDLPETGKLVQPVTYQKNHTPIAHFKP